MGKAAKRREIARLLKERKIPHKLYHKGFKKDAYENQDLNRLLRMLQYKPNDLVHDCTGFNHIIKEHMIDNDYGVLHIHQFEFSDIPGQYSCGCKYSPGPPDSAESINAWFHSIPDAELRKWGRYYTKIADAIAQGKPFIDDRGVLLKEFI